MQPVFDSTNISGISRLPTDSVVKNKRAVKVLTRRHSAPALLVKKMKREEVNSWVKITATKQTPDTENSVHSTSRIGRRAMIGARKPQFRSDTPYSLDTIIKKIKGLGKFEKRGKTATAPIMLVGLKEGTNIEGEIKQENTRTIAIFKFATEKCERPARKIEKFVKGTALGIAAGFRRSTFFLPGKRPESKLFAERWAYILSEKLGAHVVPETDLVYRDQNGDITRAGDKPDEDPNKELGTVQVFLDKSFETADKHIKEDKNAGFTKEGLNRFQKCTIMSYLLGGIDCHLGNIMSRKDDQGRYVDFDIIDNGNSCPEEFPEITDRFVLNNYCGWGKHPLAKEVLTEEARQFINSLTADDIISFALEAKEEMRGFCKVEGADHTDTFFSQKMLENTVIRLNVLKMTAMNPDSKVSDISKVKTLRQTERYLASTSGLSIEDIQNQTKVKIEALSIPK